jgi:clan AA aspartic protease
MMGHVNVKLKLANPVNPSGAPVETTALVDTGATFTTIPRGISEKLGLLATGKRKVRTATQIEILEQSFASVEIDGNLTVTPVLVSETLDKVLIGVITLEALGLAVDPTTGRLNEAETYLL